MTSTPPVPPTSQGAKHPAANNLAALCGASETARLAQMATLGHVLFGDSAIDAARLFVAGDDASIEQFLRLNGFATTNPLDRGRLDDLLHEATEYLTEYHQFRLPLAIEQPQGGVADLLRHAASPARPLEQRAACIVLKAMCILHHISGRELLFNTAISEAQLFAMLSKKVFVAIDQMRALGIRVQEFAAGKKSRASLTTKLLAKRTNLATHIFDKLRFRVVVQDRDDLVYALVYLLQHLVPFNYVLPAQSENTILRPQDISRVLQLDEALAKHAWQRPRAQGRSRQLANEFSATDFHTINFVADIPLRIDDLAPEQLPAIVFVQTEIQLLDRDTARANEEGDSAHPLYKKRQRARVRSRLNTESFFATPATPR